MFLRSRQREAVLKINLWSESLMQTTHISRCYNRSCTASVLWSITQNWSPGELNHADPDLCHLIISFINNHLNYSKTWGGNWLIYLNISPFSSHLYWTVSPILCSLWLLQYLPCPPVVLLFLCGVMKAVGWGCMTDVTLLGWLVARVRQLLFTKSANGFISVGNFAIYSVEPQNNST